MRGSTIPVYTRNAPRTLWHVPALISRSPGFSSTENNSPACLLQYFNTVVDGARNRNVRGAGWDPQMGGDQRSRKVPHLRATQAARASPPQTDETRSDSGSCEERSKRPATWIRTTKPGGTYTMPRD